MWHPALEAATQTSIPAWLTARKRHKRLSHKGLKQFDSGINAQHANFVILSALILASGHGVVCHAAEVEGRAGKLPGAQMQLLSRCV